MHRWDGFRETSIKRGMDVYGPYSAYDEPPPIWYVDTNWEEILSMSSAGDSLTPNATGGTVYTAVTGGYRMRVGVLVHPDSGDRAWLIYHADPIVCSISTETCQAFFISQYETTNPFTLGKNYTRLVEYMHARCL